MPCGENSEGFEFPLYLYIVCQKYVPQISRNLDTPPIFKSPKALS